jgi:hypothetical protein
MDPSYENVVDVMGLLWTMAAYLVHGVIAIVHVSLACFLIGTGAHDLARPDRAGRWLRRLGAVAGAMPRVRAFGALRLVLGLLLFAPLAVGAPTAVSLVAGLGAFALLVWTERRLPMAERPAGRLIRNGSIGFAAVAALFMLWEREDNLTLAADVSLPATEWRSEEIAWQLERDPQSPKVGDLAPDFELQDPEGVTRVRLSDFRGKRPVALVFGSYT